MTWVKVHLSKFNKNIENPLVYKRPCLANVVVSENPLTKLFANAKIKACEEVGIEQIGAFLPENSTQEDVFQMISDLNADKRISGIIVHLPLPSYFSSQSVFDKIKLEKDIDGLNIQNIGRIVIKI